MSQYEDIHNRLTYLLWNENGIASRYSNNVTGNFIVRHIVTCYHVHQDRNGLYKRGYLRYCTLELTADKFHGLGMYQRVF